MKYILVTGGVISGIGKGVITSSIGTLFKSYGYSVTAIKIDPYINIDAGTFSPYEHGEVFVLDDGGEVDLDLGNYERFLDVTLHRDNNITTGKIYRQVIARERKGDYLGKTVQVVPHITDAIQDWVERVANESVDSTGSTPEICVIELGGTIGDIEGMPFVEAFRQFQFRVKGDFCNIHVSLVPKPKTTGEHKTKPTQSSVRQLRSLGLTPDMVFCRSDADLSESVKQKIAMFCNLEMNEVVTVRDASSLYHVPILLEEQGVVESLHAHLHLDLPAIRPTQFISKWKALTERSEQLNSEVRICLVGKYTDLEDAYASVSKALLHSSLAIKKKLKLDYVKAEELEEEFHSKDPVLYHGAWQTLCSADGILVPGGFGDRGIEGKVLACKWAREKKVPFLGVCLGMQCAVIEYGRTVLGWDDANSVEFNKDTTHPVIVEMPEHHPGEMGGTMRLGLRKTLFHGDSRIRNLYGGGDSVEERHRHRYEVYPEAIEHYENKGLKFVGRDETGQRMEIMELPDHPYYVAVQYHPEYLSRPLSPSPPYLGLLQAAARMELKPMSFYTTPTSTANTTPRDTSPAAPHGNASGEKGKSGEGQEIKSTSSVEKSALKSASSVGSVEICNHLVENLEAHEPVVVLETQ